MHTFEVPVGRSRPYQIGFTTLDHSEGLTCRCNLMEHTSVIRFQGDIFINAFMFGTGDPISLRSRISPFIPVGEEQARHLRN